MHLLATMFSNGSICVCAGGKGTTEFVFMATILWIQYIQLRWLLTVGLNQQWNQAV